MGFAADEQDNWRSYNSRFGITDCLEVFLPSKTGGMNQVPIGLDWNMRNLKIHFLMEVTVFPVKTLWQIVHQTKR